MFLKQAQQVPIGAESERWLIVALPQTTCPFGTQT
jgi:hypothetical protein